MHRGSVRDIALHVVCLSIIIPLLLFSILMFLLYVIPVGITFYFMIMAVFGGNIITQMIFKKSVSTLDRYLLAMISCIAILAIIFSFSFGVFTYANYQEVCGHNVRGCLPEAATDITVEKSDHHHAARFRISKDALDAWHDDFWIKYGHGSRVKKDDSISNFFDLTFAHLGWTEPEDAEYYFGPDARMGPGYSLWFSPSKQVAYLYFGYW